MIRVDLPEPDTPDTVTNSPAAAARRGSEVVLAGAPDGQPLLARLTPLGGHGDRSGARQVLAGDAVRVGQQIGDRTGVHHMPAELTGARPDVDHVVGYRMVSSSCSTTMTVLPRSRRRINVSIRRLLSR